MRIGLFINFCLIFTVLGLSSADIVFFAGAWTRWMRSPTQSAKNTGLCSSQTSYFRVPKISPRWLAAMSSQAIPIYEQFFFEILDIRNGKRPRPRKITQSPIGM